ASAAKKAGRVAAEGLVSTFTNDDHTRAVVAELNCETDFVAKTPEFGKLLAAIGDALLAANGIALEGDGAAAGSLRLSSGKSLAEVLNEAVASIGEHIALRRYTRIDARDGRVGSYVHAGGKIGVLVEVAAANENHEDVLRSLAMQIAAAMPRYVRREEVTAADLAGEREIFRSQAAATGK